MSDILAIKIMRDLALSILTLQGTGELKESFWLALNRMLVLSIYQAYSDTFLQLP